MKIRICDYIFQYLAQKGIKRVYGVVAGGCSGLNDGLACNKDIQFIPLHGEGACGYAAIGDSKYTNELSCVVVGTGCCNTNLCTSILTAWQDSQPVIFIAGDVNTNQLISDSNVRNFGVQGNNPVDIFKSITKFAKTLTEKDDIPYWLAVAVDKALSNRRGPVFLNIPTDLQTVEIEVPNFSYWPDQENKTVTVFDLVNCIELIKSAKRPVLLVGNGARNAKKELENFSEFLSIPIVSTYGAQDFLRSSNYISTVGTKAARAGNFVLHQSDLVIVLGCSLNVSVTGYNFKLFAPNAKIVVCDIDEKQHAKNGIKIDQFYNLDVKEFLNRLNPPPTNEYHNKFKKWLDFGIKLKTKYPILPENPPDDYEGVNPYYFLKNLYKNLKEDSVVIGDAGGSFYSLCQSYYPNSNQRLLQDVNNAAMYSMIPIAIGASFAKNKGEIIGVCGDGSFSGMLQELSSVKYNNLPIKIFIINNNGYNSLKKTQENFFKARYLGINKNHGLGLPEINRIATCFEIPYFKIEDNKDLERISFIMSIIGPTICEVVCPENMMIQPTIGSKMEDGKIQSMPLWNMAPFIPEEELNKLLEEVKNL